jgi:hypothetical protein
LQLRKKTLKGDDESRSLSFFAIEEKKSRMMTSRDPNLSSSSINEEKKLKKQ